MVRNKKTGLNQNWVKSNTASARKSDAEKFLEKAKKEETEKKYVRIPHPTLKNTFILKEED